MSDSLSNHSRAQRSPSTATKPERSSNWNLSRPPTIDDLRRRHCWVCLEEEDFDAERSAGQSSSEPRRRWIHPCKCSLVAHEACLMEWLEARDENPAFSEGVKCPQCKTQYIIKFESRNVILSFLNKAHLSTSSLYGAVAGSAAVGGVLGACGIYGALLTRALLGRQGFQLFFGKELSEWVLYSFQFITIPPVIIASETMSTLGFLTLGIVPSMGPFFLIPGSFLVALEPKAPIAQNLQATASDAAAFPPTPLRTLLYWPIARLVYNTGATLVLSRIFSKPTSLALLRSRQSTEVLKSYRNDLEAQQEVAERELAEAQALLDEMRNRAGEVQEEAHGHQAAQPAERREVIEQVQRQQIRRIQLNFNGVRGVALPFGLLAKQVISPLLTPFMGIAVGYGLRFASTRSKYLRGLLGLGSGTGIGVGFGFGSDAIAAQTRFPSFFDIISLTPSAAPGDAAERRTIWPTSSALEGIDPVWWSGALGIALYTFLSDSVALLHVWLAQRERKKRTVLGRSFAGIDYRSLDLRQPTDTE